MLGPLEAFIIVSWVVSAIAALLVTDRRVPQPVVVTGTLTDHELEAEKARILERRS
jgi:hypothetical protein